jgi:hypothetical protein
MLSPKIYVRSVLPIQPKSKISPSQLVDRDLALCAQLTQKIGLHLEQSEDLVILLL